MIDYEAEYNNRARVPEHPEIFARWEREGAAYRAEASAAGRAELGIKYGPSARQFIDLFAPAGAAPSANAPLALFIHGGYWRSLHPSQFSQVARGLNRHGIAVAAVGYDLAPQVKIAGIVDQVRAAAVHMWRRAGRRLLVFGHSAGGHLAACLVATDWKALASDLPADLVPAGLAISGVFDLGPLVGVSMNQDFGLTADSAHAVSPLFWPVAPGRALDAWCGSLESSEFRRQNRIIAEDWGRRGVATAAREVAGANHFTILDPLADPASEMVRRLLALGGHATAAA